MWKNLENSEIFNYKSVIPSKDIIDAKLCKSKENPIKIDISSINAKTVLQLLMMYKKYYNVKEVKVNSNCFWSIWRACLKPEYITKSRFFINKTHTYNFGSIYLDSLKIIEDRDQKPDFAAIDIEYGEK